MKAYVNETLCVGCGTCEALCPDVFKLQGAVAKVIRQTCTDCCQSAKESCPVEAIWLEE